MGANTKALRQRIKSVDSTLHLTKAMGLVASSKIRKATDRMNKSRDYAQAVRDTVDVLASCPESAKSAYLAKRDTDRIRLVVIAGDRGLAGGYNSNVFKLAGSFKNAEIIPIGKRACERYGGETLSSENFTYDDAGKLAEKLCDDFKNGDYDRLGIVCTKYLSIMSQETQIIWVLPLERGNSKKIFSVLFEPDEMTILDKAVPEYVKGTVIAAMRESFLSEVAARRTAMDSAGKNAQQMIDNLQLEYNRARQGAITQEITEIVAGSGT